MATATTYGARAHARAQEGTRADAMPVVPASAWPAPPCEAGHLVWAETVAGGNYTHKVLARGTELRLTDLERRRLRPSAPLRRRPAVGAPERGRHGEGAVERLPRRGPVAPLRPGPGPRLGDRRHLRAARRAVRHLRPGRQHGAVRRRHAAGPHRPPGASCSSWRRPSTAWAARPAAVACPSSRACEVARTAPWTSPARPVPAARRRCAPSRT